MPNEMSRDTIQHSLLHHNVLIVWRPEYNLGIPIIDEQHRGIVTTINSFHYAMQHKHGESMLHPVIAMVKEYTHIHFEVEENFLKYCEFPDLENHIVMHNELRHELTKIGGKSLMNQNPYQFMDFLKKWWIDHICEKDRVFHEYLLKIERKK
ncbi:MAG: bacteriohemerythrin [Treponema sp.]|jgi:hemerythrin|nr:bacteriohemerythrin [Treponema sp.]